MDPNFKTSKLLYVSDALADDVLVFGYRTGRWKRAGTLYGFNEPDGMCSDAAGNVWVTNLNGHDIVEYAHGGTNPLSTLSEPDQMVSDCSISKSGNLAVSSLGTQTGSSGYIAIYSHATGKPHIYTDSNIPWIYFCGYDDLGNLLLDGVHQVRDQDYNEIDELTKGSSTFINITLKHDPIYFPGGIKWDGKHWAIRDDSYPMIYQVVLDGSAGRVVGKTPLLDASQTGGAIFINDQKVIVPELDGGYHEVGLFPYPSGGSPARIIEELDYPIGVTVSAAPKP